MTTTTKPSLLVEATRKMKLTTILHTFDYDTNKPETWPQLPGWTCKDAARFDATLRATPGRGHKMHAMKSDRSFDPQPGPIELETEFLFGNQWNSSVGRVFDWYEEAVFYPSGKQADNIKRGHYLEITPQMVEIRNNVLKCRYTGQQFSRFDFPDSTPRLNVTPQALGSPYLKETELHLLRLLPVSDELSQCKPLTKEERDYILPLYIAAQTKVIGEQRKEQREEVIAEHLKATTTATTEREGKLWLLDNGVPLENCIFYTHTGRFCFGWRSAFTGESRTAMLNALVKFPFEYDLK